MPHWLQIRRPQPGGSEDPTSGGFLRCCFDRVISKGHIQEVEAKPAALSLWDGMEEKPPRWGWGYIV